MHFDEALKNLLWAEGGLKEHKPEEIIIEAGGAANFGITVVSFLEWKHKKGLLLEIPLPPANLFCAPGVAALKAITPEEVREFYWEVYGKPMLLDQLTGRLTAIVLLDQAPNRGKTGVKKRLNVTLNKHFGCNFNDVAKFPDYIVTLNSLNDRQFFYHFLCDCQDSYAEIVLKNPSRMGDLAGWLNRTQISMGLLV